jgi:hypothetical protein
MTATSLFIPPSFITSPDLGPRGKSSLQLSRSVPASSKRSRKKLGRREYLNDADTRDLMKALNQYFEMMVEMPRIRVGKRQTIETLINEEALLFAKYLRDERETWIPRMTIAILVA